jgi:hypothetical protein
MNTSAHPRFLHPRALDIHLPVACCWTSRVAPVRELRTRGDHAAANEHSSFSSPTTKLDINSFHPSFHFIVVRPCDIFILLVRPLLDPLFCFPFPYFAIAGAPAPGTVRLLKIPSVKFPSFVRILLPIFAGLRAMCRSSLVRFKNSATEYHAPGIGYLVDGRSAAETSEKVDQQIISTTIYQQRNFPPKKR